MKHVSNISEFKEALKCPLKNFSTHSGSENKPSQSILSYVDWETKLSRIKPDLQYMYYRSVWNAALIDTYI